MKTLPKKIGEYATYEDLLQDYQHTDQWLSLPKVPIDLRQAQLDRLKIRWEKDHSALAEQSGVTPEHIQSKAGELTHRIVSLIAPALGPGGQIIEDINQGDRAQAAIDAAFLGTGPEALAGKAAYRVLMGGMLRRIATAATAGAIGGATQGQPGMGALKGAGEALGGEAVMGGLKFGSYVARKHVMPGLDFARVAGWLGDHFGVKIPDVDTMHNLFKRGDIIPKVQQTFDQVQGQVERKLGQKFTIKVPTPAAGPQQSLFARGGFGSTYMDLKGAIQALDMYESHGWNLRGKPNMTGTSAAMRDAAHNLEESIAEQIDTVDKKLGVTWNTARGHLKAAKTIRNMFNEPGAFTEAGPQMHILQGLVNDDSPGGYIYPLQQSMGEEGVLSFRKMIKRGEPDTRLIDRPGQNIIAHRNTSLGVSGHGSIWSRLPFQMPYPSRYVGDVPFQFGKDRILRATAAIGPHAVIQSIHEMTAGGADLPPTKITPAISSAPLPAMEITKPIEPASGGGFKTVGS